jgi:hypothetical protein
MISMRSLAVTAAAVLITLFSITTCGSYTDIAEENDPTTPLGENSKTFMRTYEDGSINTVEMITMQDPVSGRGEIDIVQIDDDTVDFIKTVVMLRSAYELSGGNIILYPLFRYEGDYKIKNPSSSSGATREEYSEGFSTSFSYIENGGETPTITVDGLEYTSFPHVIEDVIDLGASLERAKQMMLLTDLSMIHSQIKIKEFGGRGMSQYFGPPSTFKGTRVGTFDLSLSGLLTVTSHFDYDGYSDYEGLYHNGRQTSTTGTDGDGSMSDTVSFTAKGSDTTVQGSIDFSNIELTATVSSGGHYLVTVDGGDPWDVPHDVTNPGNPAMSYLNILPADSAPGKLSLPAVQ